MTDSATAAQDGPGGRMSQAGAAAEVLSAAEQEALAQPG